jgi:hypothetical protein
MSVFPFVSYGLGCNTSACGFLCNALLLQPTFAQHKTRSIDTGFGWRSKVKAIKL